MDVTVIPCQKCKKPMNAPASLTNVKVKCPECGHGFEVNPAELMGGVKSDRKRSAALRNLAKANAKRVHKYGGFSSF